MEAASAERRECTAVWARFFGVARTELERPGLLIVPHARLAGYAGAWLFRRGDVGVISVPHDRLLATRLRAPALEPASLVNAEATARLFGEDVTALVGPAYWGVVTRSTYSRAPHHGARPIGSQDAGALRNFKRRLSLEDASAARLDREVECFVVFDGSQLAAVATWSAWEERAGDVGVATDPALRGHGFARAVASALIAAKLERGHTVLYQTLETNEPALAVARALGVEPDARHLAVRLRSASP